MLNLLNRCATYRKKFARQMFLPLLFICANVIADGHHPLLTDRTSEHLQGLSNDDSVKTLGVADYNNDGFDDIAIARRGAAPILLLNDSGLLTNRTGDLFSAAQTSENATYVESFDANGDGFIDLVFAVLDKPIRLHLNRGMRNGVWSGFDAGTDLSSASNALTIESGDINGDGTADDLFINQVLANNVLLINDGTGNFRDASDQLDTLRHTVNNGHFGLVDDANADGVDDIMYILADDNLFVYYNDGVGNFSSSRRKSFQNEHFGQPLAYTCGCADFNGDGIFDFAVHADGGGDDRLTSFMSTGVIAENGVPEHVFVDQPGVPGRMSRRHGLPDVGDLDGDGDLDYVQSSLERVHGTLALRPIGVRTLVVLNTGLNSGIFEPYIGEDWGKEDSHDVKFIDINADGNLDLFIGHDTRYGVYINAAPPRLIELDEAVVTSPAEVGSSATMAVSLLSGTNATYLWDFGDGNTANTDRPTVNHVYDQPGHYAVTVTVSGVEGSDQANFKQTVYSTLTADQPSSSSGMQYEATSNTAGRLFVVAPDHDQVSVIDTTNSRMIAEIPVGDEPQSIALGATNRAYVVNKTGTSISIINTESLSVVDEVALPYASRPHGIVVDATNEFAYIALEATGKVLKLSLPALTIVGEVNMGPVPRELSLSGDGLTLYAPRFITPPLEGESTRTVSTAGNAEVLEINTSTMTVSGQIDFPVNDVSVAEEERGTSSRGIPNYLRAPVISPSGTDAIIPAKLDNIFRGSMRDGKAREHDKLVRGLLLKFNTQTNEEVMSDRFDFDNNSAPTAVAYGPTGSYVFAIHEGSRAFEVIDAYSNTVIFRTTAEFAPRSIAVSPDGNWVYIHNYLSRTVSVYETASIIANLSSVAELHTTVKIVSNEILSPEVLRGKILFHDSEDNRLTTQGYISCAACHDDAGHDGRTWDFSDAGEGLRNTIDLRGRAATRDGNVHWSANFDEFHDFENDIREIFDGTGLLSDVDFADSAAPLNKATPKTGLSSDLDALAAYGASLDSYYDSPFRESDGSLTAAGVAGKQVFIEADCAACHNGTAFTNSPSDTGHNIGTVDDDTGGRLGMPLLDAGLDTPTLRGLWHGAPYLHDGSAPTLKDAVLAHSNAMTVDVAQLSATDIDSLVAYLLQLDDKELSAPERLIPTTTEPPVSNPVFTANMGGISIDGSFSDWLPVTAYPSDANDVSGNNNTLDFAQASLAHNETHLFIHYELSDPDDAVITWGLSVQLDTDANPDTGFQGFAGELPIGVDYLIEGNTLHRYTGSGRNFSWSAGTELSVATDGPRLEMAVPRSLIANSTLMNLFFFANSESVGGDAADFYPDAVADGESELSQRFYAYQMSGSSTTTDEPVVATTHSNFVSDMAVDGDLSDWSALDSFGTDPDDVNSAIDWREAWFAHNQDSLFIAWRNDEAAQLTWRNGIMFDTDQNTETGFRGFNNELPIGIDLLLEADQLYRYIGSGADWLWASAGSVTLVIAGNNVELVMPREFIGNSSAVDIFFVGKNVAVAGSSVDFYPDSVSNEFAPLSNRHFTYSTGLSAPLAALRGDSTGEIMNEINAGSLGMGSLWLGLLVLIGRSGRYKVASRLRAVRCLGLRYFIAMLSTVVITACSDSGVYVGPETDARDQPINNPSFESGQQSESVTINPSFAAALPVLSLDGTQSVPPVSTRAQGSASLVLNQLSGHLTGQVTHSVTNATGASISIGEPGQLGAVLINLEAVNANNFRIPIGTVLSSTDIALYQEGRMFISIDSMEYPDGEIRAQISNEIPSVGIEPTLKSLQATVFTPTCSGCHNGTGSTAPGAMNLTTAERSYDALVNMPSLQEPDKMRVSINDSSSSYLVTKLTGTQTKGSRMPFRGMPLDTHVIDTIRQWIDTGANAQ